MGLWHSLATWRNRSSRRSPSSILQVHRIAPPLLQDGDQEVGKAGSDGSMQLIMQTHSSYNFKWHRAKHLKSRVGNAAGAGARTMYLLRLKSRVGSSRRCKRGNKHVFK